MNASIFISGTDTGVGKTWVTGMIARSFQNQRKSCITQKWIQTGTMAPIDVQMHDQLMGFRVFRNNPDRCPYIFPFPGSPLLAADLASQTIEIPLILEAYNRLTLQYDRVLVEGSGGLLVPITPEVMMIDLIKLAGLPVILVADNRLGAINQTLLSIQAIQTRNIPFLGVVWVQTSLAVDPKIVLDNPQEVANRTQTPILATVPFLSTEQRLTYPFTLELMGA